MNENQSKKEEETEEVKGIENVEVVGVTIVNDTKNNEIVEDAEVVEAGMSQMATYAHTQHNNPFASEVPNPSDSFALVKETANALEHINQIANHIRKSQLCPLKSEGDITVAILTGNQYGLPFMTSINNIYPINGKPTMSVHITRALLLKAKVIFKKIYDFEPVYEFGKLNADKSGWDFKDVPNPNGQGTTKVIRQIRVGTVDEINDDGFAKIKEVDRVTKYKFKRVMKLDDGSFEPLEVTSEFRMSDGAKAGLLEKDNWIKHPARMLDARAFSIGGREIGADILLGISSLNELADDYNIKYTVSSSLEEAVITN